MAEKLTIDAMWDDSPIDVSTEVNFIWSIANKLRGTYQSDKYKDVIIPMVIIRRFECALAPTKKRCWRPLPPIRIIRQRPCTECPGTSSITPAALTLRSW